MSPFATNPAIVLIPEKKAELQFSGDAAQNKGMALFPRKINEKYARGSGIG